MTFKISEEDRDKIRGYAESKGLPASSYCRFIILKSIKENGTTNQTE